jgi:hypothetical protein
MDFPRARKELEVMSKVLDVLEPLENDVARLRVLCAVAVSHGHYDVALDLINDLKLRDTTETPGPFPSG